MFTIIERVQNHDYRAGIRNVLCKDAAWGEGARPVCWCDRDVGASTRTKSSSSTVEGQ